MSPPPSLTFCGSLIKSRHSLSTTLRGITPHSVNTMSKTAFLDNNPLSCRASEYSGLSLMIFHIRSTWLRSSERGGHCTTLIPCSCRSSTVFRRAPLCGEALSSIIQTVVSGCSLWIRLAKGHSNGRRIVRRYRAQSAPPTLSWPRLTKSFIEYPFRAS